MCTKSLPETLFHLESLTDAGLPTPWEVTDEEHKARDKPLAPASDLREAQGSLQPGEEEEQGHGPGLSSLAGASWCVVLPLESAASPCHPAG